MQLFTHIYQLKLIPPTGIVNEDGVGNKIERQFSYGYPTEPTTCGLWENYYHTAFHQKVQDGIGVNRELFLAFGISPWLIDKPDVLLVTSAPLPAYGVESEFCYSHVTEIINEKKRVEYEYMCQSNTYDAAEGANAPYYDMSLLLYDSLKSASNLNGNLNCSKELEHYAS